MKILAAFAAATVFAVILWKVQIKVLWYAGAAILIALLALSIISLNFAKDQDELGWVGDLGIYCLAVGFLAIIGRLVRTRSSLKAKRREHTEQPLTGVARD